MLFHVFADGRKISHLKASAGFYFYFSSFILSKITCGYNRSSEYLCQPFQGVIVDGISLGFVVRLAAAHSHHVPQRKTWTFSVSFGGREEGHARNFLPLGFSERWFWFLIPLWCEMRWNYSLFFFSIVSRWSDECGFVIAPYLYIFVEWSSLLAIFLYGKYVQWALSHSISTYGLTLLHVKWINFPY